MNTEHMASNWFPWVFGRQIFSDTDTHIIFNTLPRHFTPYGPTLVLYTSNASSSPKSLQSQHQQLQVTTVEAPPRSPTYFRRCLVLRCSAAPHSRGISSSSAAAWGWAIASSCPEIWRRAATSVVPLGLGRELKRLGLWMFDMFDDGSKSTSIFASLGVDKAKGFPSFWGAHAHTAHAAQAQVVRCVSALAQHVTGLKGSQNHIDGAFSTWFRCWCFLLTFSII